MLFTAERGKCNLDGISICSHKWCTLHQCYALVFLSSVPCFYEEHEAFAEFERNIEGTGGT